MATISSIVSQKQNTLTKINRVADQLHEHKGTSCTYMSTTPIIASSTATNINSYVIRLRRRTQTDQSTTTSLFTGQHVCALPPQLSAERYCFHRCLSVCLFVNRITQKTASVFARNLENWSITDQRRGGLNFGRLG